MGHRHVTQYAADRCCYCHYVDNRDMAHVAAPFQGVACDHAECRLARGLRFAEHVSVYTGQSIAGMLDGTVPCLKLNAMQRANQILDEQTVPPTGRMLA